MKTIRTKKPLQALVAALTLASCIISAAACGLLDNVNHKNEETEESLEQILDKALSIPLARKAAGRKDVWVRGYIIGGDLSNKKIRYRPPFEKATNLAIAFRPDSLTARDSCMSVSLPQGELRNKLNLVSNDTLLLREVCIQGDIEISYFGLVGIKPAKSFRLIPD